jgi:hypothetical protein
MKNIAIINSESAIRADSNGKYPRNLQANTKGSYSTNILDKGRNYDDV